MWISEDPRIRINKRAKIIITRKHGNHFQVGTASVETKNAYCIWTSFEDRKFVSADDNWEDFWFWTWVPDEFNTDKDL